MADALRPGEELVGELQRLEMRVALERLKPFGRVARAVLELEHLEAALRLIFVECCREGESLASSPAERLGRGTIERRFDGGAVKG